MTRLLPLIVSFILLSCGILSAQIEVLVSMGTGYGLQYQTLLFDHVEQGAEDCSSNVTTTGLLPTAANVDGKDIVIISAPSGNVSAAAAAAIDDVLAAGGILFLIGENGAFIPFNNRLDDLLTQLGSSMSNQNYTLNTQCNTNPMTIVEAGCALNGLNSFLSQAVSPLFEGNGIVLVEGAGGEPCFVEESFNGGTIFYVSDINWLDPPACPNTNGEAVLSNMICDCLDACEVNVITPIDSIFFCEGDPPFLLDVDITSEDDPVTIIWTATNGGDAYLDDVAIEDPLVTLPPNFEGVITYYIEIEGASGDCQDYDSIIVVASLNPIPVIEPADSICMNEPGYFLTATPENGEWGGAADEDGYIDPMILGGGMHIVTYSFTSDDMCTGDTMIEIVISDTAIIDIEPVDDPMCLTAGDIELIATPVGGVWSDPVVGTIFNPEDAGLGLTELTYTYVTENGCETSKSIEFLIIPEFVSEIIGPDELCTTDGLTLYQGIAADGEWGGAANFFGEVDPLLLGIGIHEITYSSPPANCNVQASFFVEIFEPPFASVEEQAIICNGGPETILNFDALITDGDINGTWVDVDGSGASGNFPLLDFTDVLPGMYHFQYTTNSAEGTCEEQVYDVIIIVEECACPSLALENPEDICQVSVVYDLEIIKITDEEGTFTIISDPGGMNPAELVNNILQGTDVDAGIYVIQFTLANPVDGCPDSVVFEILITETAMAEVIDTIVCNAEGSGDYASILDLTGLVINGDMTGTWVDVDGSGANGPNDALDFEGVTPGVYTFEYTTAAAVMPCENVTYSVEITVLDCDCPELSVLNTGPFCSDVLVLDLASVLISDGTGTWEVVTDPGGMNPAEIIGEELIGMEVDAGIYVLQFTLDEAPPTGCAESVTLVIEVNAAVELELLDIIEVCNSEEGGLFEVVIDLGATIIVGGMTGTWVDLDGSGANGPNDALDFTGVLPGMYTFVYTTNEAIAPCEEAMMELIVVVLDCNCPELSVMNAGPYCSDMVVLDLASILTSDSSGTWAIIDDPGGMNPAEIIGEELIGMGVDAGTYVLEFTLDEAPPTGCIESVTVSIEVNAAVELELQDSLQVCNSEDGGLFDAIVDLNASILVGGTNGTWVDLDGSGASGPDDALDFTGVFPGTYTFEYTTNEAVAPCEEQLVEMIVVVNDCDCPVIELSGAQIFCNADLNIDVDLFNISGQIGTWAIVDDPGGANPAELIGTDFVGTGSDAGIYVLEFTLDEDPPQGCDNSGQVTIEIVGSLSADVESYTQICNTDISGGQTSIDFTDMVTGVLTGMWVDVDNSGATGVLPNLDFTDVPPGIYSFSYTLEVDFPCSDSVYILEVEVIECLCPPIGLDEPDDLCDTGGELNLDDLLINAAAGEWTIVDDPGGANPAEIVGNMIQSGGADAGDYVLQYTLIPPPPESCPDSGVVTLTIVAGPDAGEADGAFAVCEGESGNTSLFDLITGNDIGGQWSQIGGEDVGNALNGGSGMLNYTGLVNGVYQFTYIVEGEAPCGDDAVEVLIEIYANPIADAGADMNLDCSTPQVELGGASSQGGEYEYNWEGPSGTLGDGITQMANEAGVYTVTVINTQTGCESEDEVIVGAQGEIITNAIVEAEGIGCEGENDGVIRILNIEGGTGPYMYSANGGNFSDQNQWGGLEAGAYEILVEDVFGCQFLILTEIDDRELLELNIGGIKLELEYGEDMNLEALLNINEDEIAEIIWSSGGVELCNGCLSITIVGTESGVITVEVTDMFGCKAEASFAYNVIINENVYIPTIFSPNGDGLNDEFYVYGGESAVQVVYMRIYSRWGEMVYEARNMPLTDPEFGWDGTFKGDLMNPNVFSYELEVLFKRGVIKLYFGDVTLVR